jgi:APA family basic amino acid/polyamine antiporter
MENSPNASEPRPTPPGDSQQGLSRSLGPGMAVSMVVGAVIGSGIFLKPGQIAADGGSFLLIISAWVIGGIVCFLGGLCVAELALMMPRAGGLYVYLQAAYGKLTSFLYGWNLFFFVEPASNGALAIAFVGALASTMEGETSHQTVWDIPAILANSTDTMTVTIAQARLGDGVSARPVTVPAGISINGHVSEDSTVKLRVTNSTGTTIDPASTTIHIKIMERWSPLGTTVMAALLVMMVAGINFFGVVWGGRFQAATTIIKAGFVGLLALLPFAMVLFTEQSIHLANYSSSLVAPDASVATRFAIVMLAIMWAYSGWHFVTPVAEEIRNPRRDIPLALLGGIGILTVLYVGANLAFHGVLSMEEMKDAGETVSQTMMGKLLEPYGWGKIGGALVSAVIMCSTLGALNGGLLITPRVTLAMGRSGTFFRSFAYIHPKYRTPAVAIFAQMTMAFVLLAGSLCLVTFTERFREQSIFTLLTNYTVFCYGPFLMLTIAAVIVLRRKKPDHERPFRTPLYPWVPVIFLVFYGWFMYMILQQMLLESMVSILLILLGIPVFLLVRFLNARSG